jgi:hypothetical protein
MLGSVVPAWSMAVDEWNWRMGRSCWVVMPGQCRPSDTVAAYVIDECMADMHSCMKPGISGGA